MCPENGCDVKFTYVLASAIAVSQSLDPINTSDANLFVIKLDF